VLDQPCSGARDKLGLVEHGGSFTTKISDQPAVPRAE
jgi:hypothetical protein